MALTRDFKATIVARMRRDPGFRKALFLQAMNSYLGGETGVGKAILRDLINATVGFEQLAAEVEVPSKSLHRMLSARGNPRTESFFRIVSALQRKTGLKLCVTTKTARRPGRERATNHRSSASTLDHARLARNLGATIVGRVSAGAGYFGALQTAEEVRRLQHHRSRMRSPRKRPSTD